MSTTSRRNFIKNSTVASGATLLLAGTSSSQKVLGANDRLRVAVAGLNGRGSSHIGGYSGQPNVEIAWLVVMTLIVLMLMITFMIKLFMIMMFL